jgi:hypothetical protein
VNSNFVPLRICAGVRVELKRSHSSFACQYVKPVENVVFRALANVSKLVADRLNVLYVFIFSSPRLVFCDCVSIN